MYKQRTLQNFSSLFSFLPPYLLPDAVNNPDKRIFRADNRLK
jgi:hypothetical protein